MFRKIFLFFYDKIFICIVLVFFLIDWMVIRGFIGSLFKVVFDELLNILGIGLFKKERLCDRVEVFYSINKLIIEGWLFGKIFLKYVY